MTKTGEAPQKKPGWATDGSIRVIRGVISDAMIVEAARHGRNTPEPSDHAAALGILLLVAAETMEAAFPGDERKGRKLYLESLRRHFNHVQKGMR